ncbi:MAG: heavy metal translocating P-type ATPase [Patescibacteria group bacterium]
MDQIKAHISGMHCASCVSRIEKKIGSQIGVQSVSVNLATEEARITLDATQTDVQKLSKSIEPLGYTLHPQEHEQQTTDKHASGGHDHTKTSAQETETLRKKVFISIPLVIFAAGMMLWEILAKYGVLPMFSETLEEFFHHLLPIFATYMLFTVGTPYLRGLWMFFRRGVADMDTLIGLGTVAAFLYSFVLSAFEEPLSRYLDVSATYYDVTIVVIGLITLGKYLEARAKAKTGDAIKQLLSFQVKTATIVRDGMEQTLPVDQVQKGDIVLVKPGMKVPVDGVIAEGSSYLDESMLTGEPVPTEKQPGDKVSAGTLNTTGAFTMTATGVGSETLLAHIIAMVSDAQGSKAPIQRLADKISSIFVPVVLIIAFCALVAWLVIGGSTMQFAQALSFGLSSFVAVLVIACPCALGLATPTAIMVGVGRGAQHGILIKNAEVLEKMHKINAVVVDKTGTLTKGKPEVMTFEGEEHLSIFATLESQSEHPLAEAIVKYAAIKGAEIGKVTNFKNLPGTGVQGDIDGTTYFIGGPALLTSLNLSLPTMKDAQKSATLIALTTKNQILAVAAVGDQIKPEAKDAIEKLHMLGIKVIMATGDNEEAAQTVSQELGIDRYVAQVLPQDKLALIKELQSKGDIVAMAGDGVNDAPALAQADIGIAMATGSDVSIETSDVTLLKGDIRKIAQAIELSKATMRTIRQNLFWAFIYNIIGIPLASGIFYPAFGWLLSPVFAGFAMAMSSVSVVLNSLRLKMKKL